MFVESSADWGVLDASKFKIGARKNESCKNIKLKAKAPNLKKLKDSVGKTKF
jgi:hypothetical protein